MRRLSQVLLVYTLLLLSSCGGGTDSSPPSTTAVGDYISADGSETYILDDGTFYLVNLAIVGNGAYYVYGNGVSTNDTFSGTGTLFIFSGDLYKNSAQVSGKYVYHSLLTLNLSSSNTPESKTFSGTFAPGFLQPAKQSDVTGTYTNQSMPAMTIDDSGNLTINNLLVSPCTISGTIHPHGQINIYDTTLNFPNSSQCTESHLSGIAVLKNSSLLFLTTTGYFLSLVKS